jgi:hypothetical protein
MDEDRKGEDLSKPRPKVLAVLPRLSGIFICGLNFAGLKKHRLRTTIIWSRSFGNGQSSKAAIVRLALFLVRTNRRRYQAK